MESWHYDGSGWARRSTERSTVELVEGADVFDLYGRWNALAAFDSDGKSMGAIRAHDGDFFPESILDYVEALRTAVASETRGQYNHIFPLRVDIDITQACNANCTFCFSRPYQAEQYRGQWGRTADIESIISELADNGTRTIRYCGGGEPLVHPGIRRLLQVPHEHGLRSCLITSGDLLDEELLILVFDHIDHLRWSVNSAQDSTRIKIHRPKAGANQLSDSFQLIEALIRRREQTRGALRCPMVWATFLVIPENFTEIIEAAERLRDIGVDSVSFRPVYHGLTTPWTPANLAHMEEALQAAAALGKPPRFCVFVPRRSITESPYLRPYDEFQECLSRRMRTVLEATAAGFALQSCGMYRGSGTESGLVLPSDSFSSIWARTPESLRPRLRPVGVRHLYRHQYECYAEFYVGCSTCRPICAFRSGVRRGERGDSWSAVICDGTRRDIVLTLCSLSCAPS